MNQDAPTAEGVPEPSSRTPAAVGRASQARALTYTLVLAVTVALASLVVVLRCFGARAAPSVVAMPWWMLAGSFALAEVLVFHIEVRQEAITFTLSELPLTLGLFFVSPAMFVLARVVGGVVVIAFHERQPSRKVALNLASFLAECTAAVVVVHVLLAEYDPRKPQAWVAVLLAVAAADVAGFVMVTLAMRWHGAPIHLRKMMLTNLITVLTNTSLAILASVLFVTNRAALVLLAFVGAVILVAYRGYSALAQRYSSLQLLYEFTRLVSGSKRPEVVLESMLREARRLLRAEKAAIVIEGSDGTMAMWLEGADAATAARALPVERLANLVASGRAEVIGRNTRDVEGKALLGALDAKDCIVAPVAEGERAIGVLLVVNRETDVSTFDAEDARLFETLANHASVALENGRLIERLHDQAKQRQHEALHDSLTGLPNRACFLQELSRAIDAAPTAEKQLIVALLDLDHFKEVNDTLGHHHGDLLLREVASRLRAHLPSSTMLARLGGDEFALFSWIDPSAPQQSDLGAIIQSAVAHEFVVEGLALEIGASVGIARHPDHGNDPTTLLQRADVAMYDAKTSTSDRVQTYDAGRDVNTPRRLTLANDLRRAIENGDLQLHYQPKGRLRDGFIVGVEGLIRWRHPAHGNVPPDEFVPLAERAGLIQPFTQHVLEHGLRALRRWNGQGLNLGISLNLSMRNLLDAALPARVADLLSATGTLAADVTFEVTETSMMAEPAKVVKTLHGLAELGVRLSIDDFGTGHSSLAYIQRLPVHEVKIDKSFITPLASTSSTSAIVQSIVHLAHNLGLVVVAEGVEDAATWRALRKLDCDEVQGYHLSRPLPSPELLAWLDDRAPNGYLSHEQLVLA